MFKKNIQVTNCLLFIASVSIKACCVIGCQIVALEKDRDIFEAIFMSIKKTPPIVAVVVIELPEVIQVSKDLDAMTIIPRVFVRKDRPSN